MKLNKLFLLLLSALAYENVFALPATRKCALKKTSDCKQKKSTTCENDTLTINTDKDTISFWKQNAEKEFLTQYEKRGLHRKDAARIVKDIYLILKQSLGEHTQTENLVQLLNKLIPQVHPALGEILTEARDVIARFNDKIILTAPAGKEMEAMLVDVQGCDATFYCALAKTLRIITTLKLGKPCNGVLDMGDKLKIPVDFYANGLWILKNK